MEGEGERVLAAPAGAAPVAEEGVVGREVERALRGKASPAASIGFQLAYGKDFKGDPIESLPGMALGAVMPISLQDMQEFTEKYGVAEGVARMAPSVFGIGASDYKDRK